MKCRVLTLGSIHSKSIETEKKFPNILDIYPYLTQIVINMDSPSI